MAISKYPNLRAEMARNDISIQQIAAVLNKTRNTVAGKLAGRQPINLDEAFTLTRSFFPDSDVYYLFATDSSNQNVER